MRLLTFSPLKVPSSVGLHLDTEASVRETERESSEVGVCMVGAAGIPFIISENIAKLLFSASLLS